MRSMKVSARKTTRRQEARTPRLALAVMIDARATLHDAIVSAGMAVLGAMLEEERAKLCGPKYAHQPARVATRSASLQSASLQSAEGRRRSRDPVISTW